MQCLPLKLIFSSYGLVLSFFLSLGNSSRQAHLALQQLVMLMVCRQGNCHSKIGKKPHGKDGPDRADYTLPLLQCRSFQEAGVLSSYKDRMWPHECCVSPLGGGVFERSTLYGFFWYFCNTNWKFGMRIIFAVTIEIDSCNCPKLKLFLMWDFSIKI